MSRDCGRWRPAVGGARALLAWAGALWVGACGVDGRDAGVVGGMAGGDSGSTASGAESATAEGSSPPGLEGVSGEEPRAESEPSAGETETEPIGGCFQQLLANADFDRGHVAWTETGTLRDVIVAAEDPSLVAVSVTPRTGRYLAWLGGVPNGQYERYETTLVQEVELPPETISLTLSGYYWVDQPQLGLDPNDWAVLELRDPEVQEGYDGLWRVQLWSELDVTRGWVRFEEELTDVDRIRGRTLPLVAESRPSGNGTLSVWLDSLRLEARCTR